MERFQGLTAWPWSAEANGHLVIHALQAADFEPLLARCPHAARYVKAGSGAGAVYQELVAQVAVLLCGAGATAVAVTSE
jgi:hypothetical protein